MTRQRHVSFGAVALAVSIAVSPYPLIWIGSTFMEMKKQTDGLADYKAWVDDELKQIRQMIRDKP